MLIERAVEAKVVEALQTALASASGEHSVVGCWQPSAAGDLKWDSADAEKVAIVEVSTALASQQTFTDPTASFDSTIKLTVRLDLDRQGDLFASYADLVSAQLKAWMAATYQSTFTALDVSGFSADGISVVGGSPLIDSDSMTGTVQWTLTISGTYT